MEGRISKRYVNKCMDHSAHIEIKGAMTKDLISASADFTCHSYQ